MSTSPTSAQNTNPTSLPQNHSAIVSHVRDIPQQPSLETRTLPEPGDAREQPSAAHSPKEPKVLVSPTTPTKNPSTSNSSNAVDDFPNLPPTHQNPNPSIPTPAPVQIDTRSPSHAPPTSPKSLQAAKIDPGEQTFSASNETVPNVDVNPPQYPPAAPSLLASVDPSLPRTQLSRPERTTLVRDPQQSGSESPQKDDALNVAANEAKQTAVVASVHPTQSTIPPKVEASVSSPSAPNILEESTATSLNSNVEQTPYSLQPTDAQSTQDHSTQQMQKVTQGTADNQKTVGPNAEDKRMDQPPSADRTSSEPQSAAPLQGETETPAPQPTGNAPLSGSEIQPPVPTSQLPALIPPANRPIPRTLPKFAKNRPKNARVFIGNLASEYTSSREIVEIFHKYGTLIEEPVLRRSFGFVQYSTAEAASLAVKHEQNRIIGGIALDLSIADNREVKKGTHIQNNTPFQHPKSQSAGPFSQPRGRVRERDHFGPQQQGVRKRRRSLSPNSALRKGGVHPPQYGRQRPDPKNGIYLRILCMSPTAKGYARHCENTFRNMTGLNADILHIVATNLGEALGKAMRDAIPYVMVVASRDVDAGTCTIRTLEKTGYEKSGRGNGVIPLKEAVEVCLIERGVIMPNSVANHYVGSGPVQGNMNVHMGKTVNPTMGVNNAMANNRTPWSMQTGMGSQDVKSGWVSGARAPRGGRNLQTGASNIGNLPMHPPPPPPSMGNAGSGGYGYDIHAGNGGYNQAGVSGGRNDGYRSQDYTGTQGFAVDYNRNQSQGYNANGMGAYPDDQFNQSTNRGTYGNRADHEYDPAAVTATQRPTAAVGDGYNWNRGSTVRNVGYGAMAGTTDVSNSQRMAAPYSSGRQYNEYSNAQYENAGPMPYGSSYDSRNPYGNAGANNTQAYASYGNASGSYGPGNENREQYNPQTFNTRYDQGRSSAQYRNSGWNESGVPRPINNHMGGYYNASNTVGRSGGIRGQAEAAPDNRYMDGDYARNNANGEYSGPQGFGNRQPVGMPGVNAAVNAAGANASALNTGVDIGRLNHLISAFQQKQAAQGGVPDGGPRGAMPRMGARRDNLPPPPPPVPSASGAAAPPGAPQGVSHILTVPGVQQALQHIGGARLGSYPVSAKGSAGFPGGAYHGNAQHGVPPQGSRRGPGYYQRG